MQNNKFHEPVLCHEVVHYLVDENAHLNDQAWIVDVTLGNAGHTIEFLNHGLNVLGIDLDKNMLKIALERIKLACPPPHKYGTYKTLQGNLKDIETIVNDSGIKNIYGIMADLGVTNLQLTNEDRGFSFRNPNAKLDMRIDKSSMGLTASDLLNALRKDQLIQLFSVTCKYHEAKDISELISERRMVHKFERVGDLLEIVDETIKKGKKTHPATRVFLALRIAVNSELDNLKQFLPSAFNVLGDGGRLAVISFHSKEDVLVKDFFTKCELQGRGKVVTKSPVIPTDEEIEMNPKSRSAKLRVIEKNE